MTAANLTHERLVLAARLRDLNEDQWSVPSLCQGWTVKHVLAHLVTPFEVSLPRMMLSAVRHRGFAGAMDSHARRLARRPHDELVHLLERNATSSFRPPGMPPATPYAEVILHSADISWALGLPHEFWDDPAMLRPVLDFLVSRPARGTFVRRGALRGLRFVATDQEWSHGEGAEVSGHSLPLAMAMAGRSEALPQLAGDGVARLAQ